MDIRFALEGDAPFIIDLLGQVLKLHNAGRPDLFRERGGKYDLQNILDMIADAERPVFIAQADGVCLGYALCAIRRRRGHPVFWDRDTLYIDDLCVDENHRGGGVGAALMEHCKSYAREIGCASIELNVWDCNQSATRFYERQGFKMLARIMELGV
ncbi:N-acetyltransferase [Clostridia bacterium]|nr:N-acetyltransferase [Clostridia bacterium]